MKPICLGFNFQMDREKMRGNEKRRRKSLPGEFLNASLFSYWFGARIYTIYIDSKQKKCTLKLS